MAFLISILILTSIPVFFPSGNKYNKKGNTNALIFSYVLYLLGYCIFAFLGIFEGLLSSLELGAFYMFILFSIYMLSLNIFMGFRYKIGKAIILVFTIFNFVAFGYLVIIFISGLPEHR